MISLYEVNTCIIFAFTLPACGRQNKYFLSFIKTTHYNFHFYLWQQINTHKKQNCKNLQEQEEKHEPATALLHHPPTPPDPEISQGPRTHIA